eukprot:PhM_4_TR5205/c1_g1_i1/m.50878/K00547/mmuM, BHMT2; homocysteine S-methyltransferase
MIPSHNFVVFDGGIGSEVERRGHNVKHPLWSAHLLETPEGQSAIRNVHIDYYLAGADVATATSYQATVPRIIEHTKTKDETEARKMIMKSVALCCEARDEVLRRANTDRTLLVIGSCGSYGAVLDSGGEFVGNFGLSETDLMNFHRDRVQLLIEAGADLIGFETVPEATEAVAVTRLMLSEFPTVKFYVSMSCKDGLCLNSGDTFEAVAREICRLSASSSSSSCLWGVGINCTDPDYIESLVACAARVVSEEVGMRKSVHVVTYPNSGNIWVPEAMSWKPRGGDDNDPYAVTSQWSAWVKKWIAAGATAVGGCCQTTPDHIRVIRSIVDQK